MKHTRHLTQFVFGLAAAFCISENVRAHHALGAFFDLEKPFSIEGELTSVRWANPHISFVLERTGSDGVSERWNVSSGSPVLLRRDGITADTFAVGDQVRITGFPSTQREREMVGAIIHMPDGQNVPMFRSLAVRLGYELSPSGVHITQDAAEAGTQAANGIFRVWSFVDDPSLPAFEPAFRQSAIDARSSYDPLTDDPALTCTPRGMPHAMDNRFPIAFAEQEDNIILQLEMWEISRTIHMQPDSQRTAQAPSPLGYSAGRWEGNTLIVTTTNIDSPWFDEIGTPQSPVIETEERFTLSADETTLDYQITITDNNTLLEPAVRRGRWTWVPGEELQPYACTGALTSSGR